MMKDIYYRRPTNYLAICIETAFASPIFIIFHRFASMFVDLCRLIIANCGRMDGWTDGWTNGWTDRRSLSWRCANASKIIFLFVIYFHIEYCSIVKNYLRIYLNIIYIIYCDIYL